MDYNQYSQDRKRVRTNGPGEYGDWHPPMDHRQPREFIPQPEPSSFPSAPSGLPRKGRGKGPNIAGEMPYTPTTEYRIPVDVYAFPPDVNIIVQLLGPRGRHQQRMKMESDTIVTTTGKGVRGKLMPGEEPLSLVIRSRDPHVPLTKRQISVVQQIYDDIVKHVKE
jgi:hypothetical protein